MAAWAGGIESAGECLQPLQFDGQIRTGLCLQQPPVRRSHHGAVALTPSGRDERLGGTEEFKTPDGQTAVYSSRARALVDAVYDWSRFNSLPQGFDWIRRELAAQRVGATDLIEASLKYGDTGTIRRMGALLEREGVASPLLRKLERALKPTTGLIPWIPNKPKRGTLDRR